MNGKSLVLAVLAGAVGGYLAGRTPLPCPTAVAAEPVRVKAQEVVVAKCFELVDSKDTIRGRWTVLPGEKGLAGFCLNDASGTPSILLMVGGDGKVAELNFFDGKRRAGRLVRDGTGFIFHAEGATGKTSAVIGVMQDKPALGMVFEDGKEWTP